MSLWNTFARAPLAAKVGAAGLAFLGLGWFGVHSDASPAPASAIEAHLRAEAEAALAEVEGAADWASLSVDGQTVTLAGAAPTRSARAAVIKAVAHAGGPGGVIHGGVTLVRTSALAHADAPSPYFFRAEAADQNVAVRGYAPTVDGRRSLFDAAERAFAGDVTGAISVTPGAPGGADWTDLARSGLIQLSRLQTGDVDLSDRRLRLTGVVASDVIAREVRSAFEDVEPPFRVATKLTVDPQSLLALSQLRPALKQAEPCAAQLNAQVASATMSFEPGTAILQPAASTGLSDLAAALRDCETAIVDIRGAPAAESARILSLARSQAVADYFIISGVSARRVSVNQAAGRLAIRPTRTSAEAPSEEPQDPSVALSFRSVE